ncbi:hypothetical protein Goklo_013251, partial [Gossypium klotzschianum]|nr:hypothetical protein [Gossypium klotzschianum]
MAQRTEKEETEFKVPETLTLCVNDCGVIGNPATNNMCQNCFNATTPKSTAAVVSSSTGGASSGGVSILNQRSTTSRSISKRSDLSPPKTTTFVRSSGSRNDPEP